MARSDPLFVATGGFAGAVVRELVERALPVGGGLPAATLLVNLTGAFALGALLDAVARTGPVAAARTSGWRHRARLVLGTGFIGAYTTYSTFAVESVQLARHGRGLLALGYVVVSVLGGVVAAAAGVVVASRLRPVAASAAPVDPDT